MRIGIGYDAHRLKAGRKCILCGVEIPCEFGPDGHSDSDVPLHALMDAMLGALALGDIGQHFPNTDERWRDARSIDMLKDVYSIVKEQGYALSNADIVIILQTPRLSQHIYHMRNCVAKALNVAITSISVKATTEEGLGFTGDGSGIASTAAVLLEKITS
ncbi:MAG: 2-C-methyl-D-erythritol 2,4-cyclodiphosphate synthase [Oscillospiraceae bacterium]|nr:2-C-methyl-D-erythritol 2,4-cyclodiphosphate synthase [Oscillospiraceae bacterium]